MPQNDPELGGNTGIVSLLCLTPGAFADGVYRRSLSQPASASNESGVATLAI